MDVQLFTFMSACAMMLALAIEFGLLHAKLPFSVQRVLELENPLPTSPFEGDYQVLEGNKLTSENTKTVMEGVVPGPEHVVYISSSMTADSGLESEGKLPGTMYTASVNGTVYKIPVSNDGELVESGLKEVVYAGPGRVLGFAVVKSTLTGAASPSLYLCNAVQGLMHWDGSQLRVVANRVSSQSPLNPGKALTYVNSVTVAASGKVYFTTSGSIPPPYVNGEYSTKMAAGFIALEGRRSGMLLEYDPQTQQTVCLMTGLWFGNGVDISGDGSYLLVASTFTSSLYKFWLTGPQAGTGSEFLGPLPALVDNVNRVPGKADLFWLGTAARPSKVLTSKLAKSKALRTIIGYLPDELRNKFAPKVGGGVLVDGSAPAEEATKIVSKVIADPEGKEVFSTPSGVILSRGDELHLYMGSLENNYIQHAKLHA